MSAREFSQDVSAAKRAATHEPVIITDRGVPSYVLLSIDDFRRLSGQEQSVVEWLTMDDDVDLEVAHLDLYRLESLVGEDPGLIEDYVTAERISFIEWPEVAGPRVERVAATVTIEHAGGDRRRLAIA